MSKIEQFNSMDCYTFDEGIAFLVFAKAPLGVINHLKSTHNRNHLHGEIHKQLRIPRVREIVKKNGMAEPKQMESNKIEPKSDKIEPKSNEIEPKSNENETSDDTPEVPSPQSQVLSPDSSEIILTKLDVRTHANTRFEDMPNELCRTLWLKRQDVYREMQQAHLKMRAVPEGEEYNEERAYWRAEVLRLYAENTSYWEQIDAEIERLATEQESAGEKANKEDQSGFDVSTYRAYISKALRKKELTPAQLVELQHRVDAMVEANVEMKPETVEKLKAKGIHFPE